MSSVVSWLNDPSHWRDNKFNDFVGIPHEVWIHVQYSGIAIIIALAIAMPLGLLIGHTGKGSWAVSAVNALRSIPGVGLLILLAVTISPHFHGRTNLPYLIPTEIVLVLIALPAILANTYAGVDNVNPAVRDAAKGMGMTGSEVLWRVELPNSLPLIFSGFRSATLQVIATATIASYFPLDGLGRYIYDGFHQQDFGQMVSGGILVAVLAVVIDQLIGLVQRFVVSRGVTGRFSTRSSTSVRSTPETDDAATGAIRTKGEVAAG